MELVLQQVMDNGMDVLQPGRSGILKYFGVFAVNFEICSGSLVSFENQNN